MLCGWGRLKVTCNYLSGFTGLDPLEIAVLTVLNEEMLRCSGRYVNNGRVVERVENVYGFSPNSAYEFIIECGCYWTTRYPLVDFNGNAGGYGFPPAASHLTQSCLTDIGKLLVSIEN